MILERIKQYIDSKGITVAAFERSVGFSNASFAKSLKNGRAIGTDKLEKILSVYPDISPMWLLKGEGNMLLGRSDEATNEIKDSKFQQEDSESPYKFLEEMIREKDKIIMGLSEKIGRLKEMVGKQEEKYAESSFSSLENAVENVL